MKSIFILLTKSDTYVSRIIRLVTADTYTHASISFDESLQPLYSFSRKYVNKPLPAGLQTESLTTGFFEKYHYIPCALYELRVDDAIYYRAKAHVEHMMTEVSTYQFNVLGLFLCRLNIPFRRNRRYFCSEFVSEVLDKSNALTLPKRPSLMRPNDYTKIPLLACRFEGRLDNLLQVKRIG
ncbi:MAG: hypothetical protein IJZ53_07840 [Tyzzerella sp.]|nr:hypothetical protein [Tyzzerella sp.]